ncbi:MAG: lipoyl(octanoyl) transferase LipB [Holosporales bacterium]|jgi:lipoyl(octanoyl) transferase|nr:lipoyl(octanoyl) transferase LipB [Holosporales bacterium]
MTTPIKFIDYGLSKYSIAMLDMQIAHDAVVNGGAELVFITEHEAMYSAGKSFAEEDFLEPPRHPVYYPNRGGRVTVHAEGQIVVYPIINLRKRNLNISNYVSMLERWMIDVLKMFHIDARASDRGIGVWIRDSKIGFVGVCVRNGVSSHGVCLNVSNDLSMFNSITPCGITGLSVTSVSEVTGGKTANVDDIKSAFIETVPAALHNTN